MTAQSLTFRRIARAASRMILPGLALSGVVALVGCERPASAPPPVASTAPSSQPTTVASTQPSSSLINIANQMIVFPPARVRLERAGQNLVALVFSDDPKDALKDDYTGNSFYLRMELDIADPDDLKDANWQYNAPSSADREDSPYGIYLGGKKVQLQPYAVKGKFQITDDGAHILFAGQFQTFDDTTAAQAPAQVLPVAANLSVRLDLSTLPK